MKLAKLTRTNRVPHFWERVERGAPDECWLWRGAVMQRTGYGCVQWRSGRGSPASLAHRIAYTIVNGRIPPRGVIMHGCNVKLCCNPAHLKLGTHAENSAAAARDGLYPRGARNNMSKLTEALVARLRRRKWLPGERAKMARRLGVARVTLNRAIAGTTWTYVPKGLP